MSDVPWTPILEDGERATLGGWAMELEQKAIDLKTAAATAHATGRPQLGLLLVRLQLMVEEISELATAWVYGDLLGVLDALSDIGYVVNGTYLTHGLHHAKVAADAEVHRSNMSKLGADGQPMIHESGRVLKGPGYSPPRLGAILAALLEEGA
jgi:predicted HAD superfamily Cof-like phosphohydrolase